MIHIYRDVEKYRLGNKLVEPSGSRSDRPGLQAMLKDASRDEFDVILARREDRLYCGLRSMLTVLQTVQDYKIEIVLAKENFDPKITPVRPQIREHYDRELRVQRRLTAIEQQRDAFTQLDLEEQVKKYVAELNSEMTELAHANPQNPEERHQVFLLKKRIVDTVLVEARIGENREIHAKFRTVIQNAF